MEVNSFLFFLQRNFDKRFRAFCAKSCKISRFQEAEVAPVPETERVMMETSGGGGRREEHQEHFSVFQTGSEGASGGKGGPEDGGMGAG